jgi:hypothetical protein
MTTKKHKEPEPMIDFVLTSVDAEDQELAGMIRPLPADVQPSPTFVRTFRAQLVTTMASRSERRAA